MNHDINSVYIETYGCSSNIADSEIMAGLLSRSGFTITNNIDLADFIILNTCIVKGKTEKRMIKRIKELQERYPSKKLVIAGCMPEAEQWLLREIAPNASLISTHCITDIGRLMHKMVKEKNKRIELIGKNKIDKTCLPKIRKNPAISIVPISSGCSSSCSYCITRLAKGDLFSYPANKIIREIENAKKAGCKEFWLTGQDCSCYGFDHNSKGKDIVYLINEITSSVKGDYFLRIGMLNPSHLKNYYHDLIEAYKHPNVFKFLHSPVQSGSDKILRVMNRSYSVKDFIEIVDSFKSRMNITLWTDIIVGFPGENEDDFAASINLIKRIRPDFVNVSRFGARPGTRIEKMIRNKEVKEIDQDIIKQRSREMTKLVEEICNENNKKWIGWSGKVLVDEYNKKRQNWIARNFAYKLIVIKDINQEEIRLGRFVNVKIIDAKSTCLIGKICK